MTRILIVEDEVSFSDPLSYLLSKEGYEVSVAENGHDALTEFDSAGADLVLLDLMLPGLSGVDVCRALRQRSNVPVIMLTAKDSEIDKVVGLELGADDYVTKPYSSRELLARIKAVLRRLSEHEELLPTTLEAGPVRMDVERHVVTVRGTQVSFPLKEFELLEMLLRNTGRVLTRMQLIDRVWGSDYVGDTKTLDVHIKRLRAKVESDPANPAPHPHGARAGLQVRGLRADGSLGRSEVGVEAPVEEHGHRDDVLARAARRDEELDDLARPGGHRRDRQRRGVVGEGLARLRRHGGRRRGGLPLDREGHLDRRRGLVDRLTDEHGVFSRGAGHEREVTELDVGGGERDALGRGVAHLGLHGGEHRAPRREEGGAHEGGRAQGGGGSVRHAARIAMCRSSAPGCHRLEPHARRRRVEIPRHADGSCRPSARRGTSTRMGVCGPANHGVMTGDTGSVCRVRARPTRARCTTNGVLSRADSGLLNAYSGR